MDKHKRLYLWEKLALAALSVFLLLGCRAQGERDALGGLIRLHVIAASDEAREQALKLRVRDAVLDYIDPLLADASGAAEARGRLFDALDGVAEAAASAAEGRAVTVTLGPADYPRRVSESAALPAGRYVSLRVTLGAGEGRNWWGLIFPQLALPAVTAAAVEETMAGEGTAPAAGEGFALRFFILDLRDALFAR